MNDFSGQDGANPGVTIQDPDRSLNNGNLNNDGAGLPVLFRQSGRLGPAPFPSSPVYPLTDVVTRGHQPVRFPDHRPVCRYVDGWHPARSRHQLRRRGALRRDAVARELVDDQLQRNEHLRERLPQRVPRRAGKSTRQHRRRPRRHVCLHRRARNGAAADQLRVFPGGDRRQEQPRVVHVGELHEQHVPDAAGDLQPQSNRVCQQSLR